MILSSFVVNSFFPDSAAGGRLTCAQPCARLRRLPTREDTPIQTEAPPREIVQVVEHLFRTEAARMVATLAGIFGVQHLALAEDVVQEALVRALQAWSFHGLPANPSAWILRTARNLALDVVRRERIFRDKEPELIRLTEEKTPVPDGAGLGEPEIADDRLRLMFVCCHPAIAPEAQAALALKTLCGFGVSEIARAFLTTDAAIAKRLTRARQRIAEARIPFEIPAGPDLERRLDGVLRALYLVFNEGYKASAGDQLVRDEICQEAIRLAELLAVHPAGDQPKTHALLALMYLHAARTPARVDDAGRLLRLQEQDRTRWDQRRLARGMFHLAHSAAGGALSEYHLQAAIAAAHGRAPDYNSTDWPQILALYDQLVQRNSSPVIALNRAVALAAVAGPLAGLNALGRIRDHASLERYHLFHAVSGDFAFQLGRRTEAAEHFQKAMALAELKTEQAYLGKRLAACATPVLPAG
jgi:RNA polymerase sigma-70 factor (ECF subfamily)